MPSRLNTARQNVCSGSWTQTSHFSLISETCCEVTQSGHTGPSTSAVSREITSGREAASPRRSVCLTSGTTLLCLRHPPYSAWSSTLSQRWHAIYTFLVTTLMTYHVLCLEHEWLLCTGHLVSAKKLVKESKYWCLWMYLSKWNDLCCAFTVGEVTVKPYLLVA